MSAPSGYTALDFVGFTDKGTYNTSSTYMRNDLVHYGGNIMRCLVDNTTNVTPVAGANWELWIGASANLAERTIAPLENNPADVAYGVGRQIIYDDWLWEVIAPIAVGDALIDYAVDPVNANIKKSAPVETQLLAVKAEADATDDMIAPTESNASSSSAAYSIGDQLILNNILYNVTAAIQVGDALTTGTGGNIEAADNLTDQLAAKINNSDLAAVATSGNYGDLNNRPTLGTAAAKNVPASGDASGSEVVMGDDSRLTNARNAADVSAWAKAANKPTYNGSEIKTNTSKTGTAQQNIIDTVASGTTMDNVVGTMLNNDKTLDASVASLNEALTNLQDDLTDIKVTGTTNNTGSTITQRTFFYLNGTLVRAKADIANGATLTENTNYEVVTAGSLNALNAQLPIHIGSTFITNSVPKNTAVKLKSVTIPKRGVYIVTCRFLWKTSFSDFASGTLILRRNGSDSTIIKDVASAMDGNFVIITYIGTLLAGDIMYIGAYHESSSDKEVSDANIDAIFIVNN